MKIRGERECTECGTRWTYYETGSIECPDCGSLHSVGRDARTEHTDSPVEFDLTSVRARVEDDASEVAERAAEAAAEYVRRTGFVSAGELQPLDETFVAAAELQCVGRDLARRMRVGDAEERYLLALLGGADEGDRPTATEVPDSLAGARGLAVATVLEAYHRDVRRWADDLGPAVRNPLSRLRDHRKRIEALDGEIDPREAERYLDAMRDVSRYLVGGDEDALATAESRLDEAI